MPLCPSTFCNVDAFGFGVGIGLVPIPFAFVCISDQLKRPLGGESSPCLGISL